MAKKPQQANPKKDLVIALLNDTGKLTKRDMAEIFEDTEYNIRKAIERAQSSGVLAQYQDAKADLLDTVQSNLMAELLTRDFAQESLRDVTMAFSTIFDKARLERGQSTENMAFMINVIDSVANERLAPKPKATPANPTAPNPPMAENVGAKNPWG
jgi:hypothetical protein